MYWCITSHASPASIAIDGARDGETVGSTVGTLDVGAFDGETEGETVGSTVGTLDVGAIDGETEGITVGVLKVGDADGSFDGSTVGETVGSTICEQGQKRSRSPQRRRHTGVAARASSVWPGWFPLPQYAQVPLLAKKSGVSPMSQRSATFAHATPVSKAADNNVA